MKRLLVLVLVLVGALASAQIMLKVDTAVVVPVTKVPLVDDDDGVTIKAAIAYNEAGMDLRWNFVTKAGATTSTAVTPTTDGTYDWTALGDGMYSIEIPAASGASINNDTEGFGWFTGSATDVAPWSGPIIFFCKSNVVDSIVDSSDYLDVNAVEVSGATPDTKADIVNEWEAQAAADPTGFKVNVMEINGTTQTARDIGASVLLSPGTGTGQISLSSGAVTVGSIANDAITANAIAADAIGSSELAATAATEIAAAVGAGVIEDTYSRDDILRLIAAVLFGQADGGTTTTLTYKEPSGVKTRLTITVNATTGNRTVTVINDATD